MRREKRSDNKRNDKTEKRERSKKKTHEVVAEYKMSTKIVLLTNTDLKKQNQYIFNFTILALIVSCHVTYVLYVPPMS